MSEFNLERRATHEDAMLLLEVLNAPVGDDARGAMEILWTYDEPPSFDELVRDHPRASRGYEQVMALLTVGERLGTFVKCEVLHPGLTRELVAMHAVWERSGRLIEDLRRQRGNPKLFENLEWLALQRSA